MTDGSEPVGKPTSLFEDLLEMLWSPAVVFDRVRSNGAGMYILVLTVITFTIAFATKGLLQPYIDANSTLQFELMAKKGTPMPPEAMKAAQAFGTWSFIGISTIMVSLGAVITGALIWAASKLVSARVAYGQAVLIAALASIPRMLSIITTAVQGVLVDAQSIRSFADASLGPARFVDPVSASQPLLALLTNLDLFNLWQLVLFAIGISVIGRVDRGTGAVAALVAWGVGVALTVVPALLT